MIPDNSPWRPVQAAEVVWRENDTPYSAAFDDWYYNSDGGLTETRHVFLSGSQLPQRWAAHPEPVFTLAETGFGTGLNFLATWQAWAALPEPKPLLHYIAIEQFPLRRQHLEKALTHWPELRSFAAPLLNLYPGLVPGQHRLLLADGRVTLDLWWHEATAALQDLRARQQPFIDAWYLDGFTPDRNQSLWQAPLFEALAAVSRPGATLATFTAAGWVRRGLEKAGYRIDKRPGYGRKRECIQGSLPERRSPVPPAPGHATDSPWDIAGATGARPDHVLVLGAGLAGATTAAALARRGVQVTVIDSGEIAGGASANAQGVLYTRLSVQHSDLVDFALQSYVFATGFYRTLFAQERLSAPRDGDLCGNFAQIQKTAEAEILRSALQTVPELAQVLDADEANRILNVAQNSTGYWYPGSGWLNPPAVCRALLRHDNIQVLENIASPGLLFAEGQWRATSHGATLASASCAVLATGTATTRFSALRWLPLQSVRGQTTQLPVSGHSRQLRAVLCHKGYIAPSSGSHHCIGASFGPGDEDEEPRGSDHRDNLVKLGEAIPQWQHWTQSLDPLALAGTVRFRCASNDYLPVVGPVPKHDAFLTRYAALRKNARTHVSAHGEYYPGLFVTTAHGSRGLTSTPLAAEVLASAICKEPPPLSRKLGRALNPARFIIRDLVRNRI